MSSNRAAAVVGAFLDRLRRSYLTVAAVALVVGLLLAPVVFFAVPAETGPSQVAVIPVAGTIDGPNEQRITTQLTRARENPDIVAVVLLMNSGGGSAVASEELYLEVSRTAEAMPVVTAVDSGALSGAYYAAAPSDEIFAKPASRVGSVGVITTMPPDVEPNDAILTTGPSKAGPDDMREFAYQRAEISNAFTNAIYEHRGAELELSRSKLTEANSYTGTTAIELGLVDRIGGRKRAMARAAELAEIEEYEITVMRGDGTVQFIAQAHYVAADSPDKELVSPSYLTGQGTPGSIAGNYLAIPPEYAVPKTTASDVGSVDRATTNEGERPAENGSNRQESGDSNE